MKKLSILALGLLVISCCSSSATTSNQDKMQNDTNQGDTLIVYFSRAGENYGVGNVKVGNTALMAGYIQDAVGGTLFEVVPTIPYPENYDATLTISKKELNDNQRPEFKNKLNNLDRYSVVFIGAPIWYGFPPMVMRTFYDAYPELANKTLIPFGTHEGSGIEGCTTILKEHFAEANILESLGLRGVAVRNEVEQSRAAIKNWITKLNLSKQ